MYILLSNLYLFSFYSFIFHCPSLFCIHCSICMLLLYWNFPIVGLINIRILLILVPKQSERIIQAHLRRDLRGKVVSFHWQSSRHSPQVVSENSHLIQQCKGDERKSESVKHHKQQWAPCRCERELLLAKEDEKQKRLLHQMTILGRFPSHYNHF